MYVKQNAVCVSNVLVRYVGYARDRSYENTGFQEELIMAVLSLLQCMLLGSFAAILGAHRSAILDKNSPAYLEATDSEAGEEDVADYEPPRVYVA